MNQNDGGFLPSIHAEKDQRFRAGAAHAIRENATAIEREQRAAAEREKNAVERGVAGLSRSHKLVEKAEREAAVAEKAAAGVRALALALAEATMDSLPLEGSPILSGRNREKLKEGFASSFFELASQGSLDPIPGSAGEQLVLECGLAAAEFGYAEVAAVDVFSRVPALSETSSVVKTKIVEAVAAEKALAAKLAAEKERALSEGLPAPKSETTLLGSLAFKAARERGEVDPARALVEAICSYAVVETLHTLGLSRMTPAKARALAEAARVSPSSSPAQGLLREESGGPVPFHTTGLEPADKKWDGAAQMSLAEDGAGYRAVCAWRDPSRPDSVKGAWKLPHHNARTGAANFAGVRAAMSALLGEQAAGIPEKDRRAVYEHLAGHFRDFEVEPPAFS